MGDTDTLAEARRTLAAKATVVRRHFDGAGSERGFDAWQCDYCYEGVRDGDKIGGDRPEDVRHGPTCPLNPERVIKLRAATVAAIVARVEELELERDELRILLQDQQRAFTESVRVLYEKIDQLESTPREKLP